MYGWRSSDASDHDISLWYSHIGVVATAVGLMKTMGGNFGGLTIFGGMANPLTELNVDGDEGVLELPRSENALGRFTKPAARILGPRRQRASTAPSECRTSCERVSDARCLLLMEPSGVGLNAGVEGEEGPEEGTGDWGEKRWP